ncbi:MAG: extracellular solute-binding protein [Oscillospiraceae bacterium]|nr:extracellular solute-binding protein [Oscillospiraceae bacterium]
MKQSKRILSCAVITALLLGITACEQETDPDSGSSVFVPATAATTPATTVDPDENAATDMEIKDLDTSLYTPDGNAGTVQYLGYYDIHSDQKGTEQCLIFESEQYGGKIEFSTCPSGDGYVERLSTLIAADESPDIVVQDVCRFPGTVSRNMFEPLDDYIDIYSPLWEDMSEVIESFAYKGKHYKVPHRITTSFALNYSKKTIEENNLPDPYELYMNGEWTWDAWRSMMQQFCDRDEGNMGFFATDTILTALISTTGVALVDAQPDGTIVCNISDPNVTRAMSFYETLCRDGVMNGKELSDWVSPQLFATNCDKLLFLGMEPEWTYTAATQEIQNKTGVENDVFDTVSDFAFVPFPRDVEADKYYQAYDVFGFAIPKGAKNIKGAVDMMNCFRVYEIDAQVAAQVREDHVNPATIYYTEGKYAGSRRWQIKWGEQEYDLWQEMRDGSKFEFLTEDGFGFNQTFWDNFGTVLNAVAFDGESWTQRSTEIAPLIEANLDEYRS